MSVKLHCDLCDSTKDIKLCVFARVVLCSNCHSEFHRITNDDIQRIQEEICELISISLAKIKPKAARLYDIKSS